jgi:hypothetical protein
MHHYGIGVGRRAIEERRQAPDEEQNEGQRGEQDVERDPAGEEEHVVLAGIVPDALDVVAQRPAKADER